MRLIGQIVGFIAIGISSVIYLQKSRSKILTVKLITDITWATHHFLLGNIIAGTSAGIAIFREILFIKKPKPVYLVIFPILLFLPLIFTYKNITSFIPPIASTLSTFGFYCKNVRLIKAFAFLMSTLMLTYAIFNNSLASAVNEIIVLSSLAISEIKVHIEKNSRYITVLVDDKGDIKK